VSVLRLGNCLLNVSITRLLKHSFLFKLNQRHQTRPASGIRLPRSDSRMGGWADGRMGGWVDGQPLPTDGDGSGLAFLCWFSSSVFVSVWLGFYAPIKWNAEIVAGFTAFWSSLHGIRCACVLPYSSHHHTQFPPLIPNSMPRPISLNTFALNH